uniref:Uncharacterized protein n=1 Tax=Kalanchoe fedtschenkoi TaxID=63787 RepID=A0A7N0U6Q2_KALFE
MSRKRARSSLDMAAVDLWKRELGAVTPRSFERTLGGSQDLVLRLQLFKKLEKHRGCVNTVSFNADGNILMSGSDDQRVILWDWMTGNAKLTFQSGHADNVFQAKFMPFTEDRSVVTCAADGQVRHVEISDGGRVETTLLAKHEARAHKLAIEPGSPHIFYSCGEDGLVQHFDLRTPTATELFKCYPHSKSYMPVVLYTIAIDPRKPNFFAVAGSNKYARLYDIRRYKLDGSSDFGQPTDCFCPPHLIRNSMVGITGLAFSEQSELLVSYNGENIYLFTGDMGSGPNPVRNSPLITDSDNEEIDISDDSSSKPMVVDRIRPQVYKGHRNYETVKGVNFFGPNCDYVTSGSDCGRIFIWKKKEGDLMRVMEADNYIVNCIESHPHNMVLASSGIDSDVKIWHPEANERAAFPVTVSRPMKRRPMHFLVNDDAFGFDLYTAATDEDYESDEDGGKDDSEEDESMDVYDEEDDEDSDSEDEEIEYEAYESCNSGESDQDVAIDDGREDDPPSDD